MTLFRHPLFAMRDIELDLSAMPAPIKRDPLAELAASIPRAEMGEAREWAARVLAAPKPAPINPSPIEKVWLDQMAIDDATPSPTPAPSATAQVQPEQELALPGPGEFRTGDRVMFDEWGIENWRPGIYQSINQRNIGEDKFPHIVDGPLPFGCAVMKCRRPTDAELAQHWGDGWIEWHGGECPVPPETLIERKYLDGGICDAPARASIFRWKHTGQGGDIIAYRICNGNT